VTRFVLSVAVLLGLCCMPRYTSQVTVPGQVGLPDAIQFVWRIYNEADPPPYVTLVTGSDLNCSNGNAFLIPNGQCLYGVTLSATMCVVAYTGRPWHNTALAHELLHAAQWRLGFIHVNHTGQEWQPGGLLEQVNRELLRNGM
jgi:hypothetical protein